MSRTLLAAGLLALVSAAACGSDPSPTIAVTADRTSFTSGSTVTFTVTVTDFELRDPASTAHSGHALRAAHDTSGHGLTPTHEAGADGEHYLTDGGHYHVYLDSTDVNPIRMSWQPTLSMAVTASAGPHRLIFRLNGDDHRFLVPEIKAEVAVTVE
jgi:hypothetical protein